MTPIILAAAASVVIIGTPDVIDGDTLGMGTHTFRLAGIDAPELGTEEGREARDWLKLLLRGRPITCVQRGHERSYDRVVGHCSLLGLDIGALLIMEGYAVRWPEYDPEGRYAE